GVLACELTGRPARCSCASGGGTPPQPAGGTPAPEVWTFLVPEGPLETSPRFQPWVPSTGNRSSPGGTAEVHSHKYRGSYSTRCLFSKARNSSSNVIFRWCDSRLLI